MTANQRIYFTAHRYLGICEIPGPKSHKLIQSWIKQAATWLDGDDSATAWCGCFRGAVGNETMTGTPPAYYRALSWSTWGVAVDVTKPSTWEQGDTLVMPRRGGNHVALLSSLSGKSALCLGGNQRDSVSLQSFPITRIAHVRRAPDLVAGWTY